MDAVRRWQMSRGALARRLRIMQRRASIGVSWVDVLSIRDMERAYAAKVLEAVGGNRTQTARLLGIDRRRLASLLRQDD